MEQGEGGDSGKRPLEEMAGEAAAAEVKKQWKNPLQVQILEDAYAVTSKPSASMKEDLARRTGLDYKQVQYWFGNRRYLERHGPRKCRIRFSSDEMLCDQGYGGYGEFPLESGLSFNSISVVYPRDDASLIPSMVGSESSISRRNSRLLKSPEPIDPQLHQSPVFSQLPLSPKMMQPHPFTLSLEEMPKEIQRIVKHVEKQLGQHLRADGPILGVDFSPLPPGAFEAPKEIVINKKASSQCCNGQLIQRPSDVTIKDSTVLNKSGSTIVSSSCNGQAVLCGSVHELSADAFSGPVQKHQYSSPQSSKCENNDRNHQAHFVVSSANAVGSSKPSDSTYVDSNISSEGQRSNATYGQQEVVHDNIRSRSQATNAQDNTHLDTGADKKTHNVQNLQMVPSGLLIVDGSAKHGQIGCPGNTPCGKLLNFAEPGVRTSDLSDGPGENEDFTLTVSSEAKNCNQNIKNQSTSNQPFELSNWHVHEHFFVRPRKRPRNRGGMTKNYFSDHSSATTLVAEWKENERRAIYFVLDIEINSSGSSGTNSTHSEGYKDQATVNLVCSTTGLTDYDNEGSDVGKNLHKNESMPTSYNNENNGQQIDKSYDDEGYNEDMESPTSSEQTI